MDIVYKKFVNIVFEIFKQIFKEGYKTDDCENYVRNCFYNLLAFMLEKGILFIEKAKSVTSEEEFKNADVWFSSEVYSQMSSRLNSKLESQSSTAFLQRLGVTYRKKNNDNELKIYIYKLRDIFDDKVKLEPLQDYFYDTLVNILVNGAALWKNDFLDSLILCNLQNDHILITYDNGVINRMNKRKSQYPMYQESIDIINYLKQ